MRTALIYSMFALLLLDDLIGIKLGFGRGLSAKNLYLYVLIGLLAIDAAFKPGGPVLRDGDLHLPFILLVCYAVFSWFLKSVSDPTYGAFQNLVTLKGQLLDLYLFFLVFRYGPATRESATWLLKAVLWTMALVSVFTLMDYLDLPNFGVVSNYQGRVEGPVGGPNQYGALLVLLLPLMIGMIPLTRGWRSLPWYAGVGAVAVLLVATGSRGAYVGLVAGVGLALVFLRRFVDTRAVMRYGALALVVVTVAVVVVLLARPEVIETVTTKTTQGTLQDASSGRTAIWGAALALMSLEPISFLTGFGWNAFSQSGIWKSAHSVYIDTLYDLGILGLILYLWLLWAVFNRIRTAMGTIEGTGRRVMWGYAIGAAGFFIALIFAEATASQPTFWMLTGLIFAVYPREQSAAERRSAGQGEVAGKAVEA